MTTNDLKDLFTDATDDLPQVDLAETAWVRAHGEQRRRQAWTAAVGAAAAVAAIVVGVSWAGRLVAPAPVTPATTAASHTLARDFDSGALVLPTMAELRELPPLLDVPLDLGLPTERPTLAELVKAAGGDAATFQVQALSWEALEDELFMPVVLVAGEGTESTWADAGVSVRPPDPHNTFMFADIRAISPDGGLVGFVQERQVLFLDVRTADVRSVPLPDDELEVVLQQGGFARNGDYLAWSSFPEREVFVARPAHTELVRAQADSRPDQHSMTGRLDEHDRSYVHIASHTPGHRPASAVDVGPDLYADSESVSGHGWVAARARWGEGLASEGLLASTVDGDVQKLLTAASDDPGAPAGPMLTPIAILDDTTDPIVLFRYEAPQGIGDAYGWQDVPTLFAAWNLKTDDISFVADGPALDLNSRILGYLVDRH